MAPSSTNEILHFMHPAHKLNHLTTDQSYLCDGCKIHGTGSRFACTICDFDMHDYCAKCPTRLTSTTHHQHPMSLLVHKSKTDQIESCQTCSNPIEGLAYHCKNCNFWIHPLCVLSNSAHNQDPAIPLGLAHNQDHAIPSGFAHNQDHAIHSGSAHNYQDHAIPSGLAHNHDRAIPSGLARTQVHATSSGSAHIQTCAIPSGSAQINQVRATHSGAMATTQNIGVGLATNAIYDSLKHAIDFLGSSSS